ncbi:MAG: RHS repeat domain-containing protein [Bacteroidota bacterium]
MVSLMVCCFTAHVKAQESGNAVEAFSFNEARAQGGASFGGDLALSFPVLTVPGAGGFNYMLNLNYNSAVRGMQAASWVGLGFNMQAGSITRNVVNRVDEQSKLMFDTQGLYEQAGNPNATLYNLFEPGDGNQPYGEWLADEEHGFIQGNYCDEGPDTYMVNLPSGSTRISPIPQPSQLGTPPKVYFLPEQWQPWKIDVCYEEDPSTCEGRPYNAPNGFNSVDQHSGEMITGFRVIKEDGTRLYFYAARKARLINTARHFEFPTRWDLTKIEAPNGHEAITFEYANDTVKDGNPLASLEIGRSATFQAGQVQYPNSYLTKISTSTHEAEFVLGSRDDVTSLGYGLPYLRAVQLYRKQENGGRVKVKTVLFEYANVNNNQNGQWDAWEKLKTNELTLIQFSEWAGETSSTSVSNRMRPPTRFEYVDVNPSNNGGNDDHGYYCEPDPETSIPTETSCVKGYAWSLKTVHYPEGGRTEYSYEQDQVQYAYRWAGGSSVNLSFVRFSEKIGQGGGRLSRIANYDGIHAEPVSQTHLAYGDGIQHLPPVMSGRGYRSAAGGRFAGTIGYRWVETKQFSEGQHNGSTRHYYTNGGHGSGFDASESFAASVVQLSTGRTVFRDQRSARGMVWKTEVYDKNGALKKKTLTQYQALDADPGPSVSRFHLYEHQVDNSSNRIDNPPRIRTKWTSPDIAECEDIGVELRSLIYKPYEISHYEDGKYLGGEEYEYYRGTDSGVSMNGLPRSIKYWNASGAVDNWHWSEEYHYAYEYEPVMAVNNYLTPRLGRRALDWDSRLMAMDYHRWRSFDNTTAGKRKFVLDESWVIDDNVGDVTLTVNNISDAANAPCVECVRVAKYDRYDQYGNVEQVTDALGVATATIWDAQGIVPIAVVTNSQWSDVNVSNVTSLSNLEIAPDDSRAVYTEYDPVHLQPKAIANSDGEVIRYEYDDARRLVNITNSPNSGPSVVYEYKYGFGIDKDGPNTIKTTWPGIHGVGQTIAREEQILYDGLGRVIEHHTLRNDNDADVVRTDYDGYGRPWRTWRPLYRSTAYGVHVQGAIKNECDAFLKDTCDEHALYDAYKAQYDDNIDLSEGPSDTNFRPYSETLYHDDPLGRPRQSIAPHEPTLGPLAVVRTDYGVAQPYSAAAYRNLVFTQVTDEDGRISRHHTDYRGQMRLAIANYGGGAYEAQTKRFFDGAGNTAQVTDPMERPTQYQYDTMGRLVWKNTPDADGNGNGDPTDDGSSNPANGGAPLVQDYQYVYDAGGRLRFWDDPNLKNTAVDEAETVRERWSGYACYDVLNRQVESGVVKGDLYSWNEDAAMCQELPGYSANRIAHQHSVYDELVLASLPSGDAWDALDFSVLGTIALQNTKGRLAALAQRVDLSEVATKDSVIIDARTYGAFNTIFEAKDYVEAIDTEIWNGADVEFHSGQVIRLKDGFKALSGAQFTARIDTDLELLEGGDWMYTFYSYDEQGRIRQMYQFLKLLGLKTFDISYDRQNNVTSIVYQPGSYDQYTLHYKYDAQGRLAQVESQNPNETPVQEAAYTYTITGQVKTIQLGPDRGDGKGYAIPAIDFEYDIRDRLVAINDPDSGNDPFAMRLWYEHAQDLSSGGFEPQRNGNIAAVDWVTRNEEAEPLFGSHGAYVFKYDDLNRLITGNFMSSALPETNGWQNASAYNLNSIGYDLTGNITSLHRDRMNGEADNLYMAYTSGAGTLTAPYSSRLTQITGTIADASASQGFAYDFNGNVTEGRGFSAAKYNYRNLPDSMVVADKTLQMRYDAAGQRIFKQFKRTDAAPGVVKETLYYVRTPDGEVLAVYNRNSDLLYWNIIAGGPIGRVEPARGKTRAELFQNSN